MDPQTEIKQWIRKKLDERGHGSRAALAEALDLSRDAVSRMTREGKTGEVREIKAHELVGIIRFFGEAPPGFPSLSGQDGIDSDLAELFRHNPEEAEELREDFRSAIKRRLQKVQGNNDITA